MRLDSSLSEVISFTDFLKVEMRVGEIVNVRVNPKAKKPAYVLTLDFGPLGKKLSSTQITQRYTAEELIGKQVIAVVNFPIKRVAGIESEVLVLAAVCQNEGTVLIEPN